MEIKRTTEIFVETTRCFVIRQTRTDECILCSNCSGQMLTAETAAAFFKISRRVVYRFIEQEKIHFSETETGEIFICPNSFDEILTNDEEKGFQS